MTQTQNYIREWELLFTQHRAYLIAFAFRMTGSLAEAEDLAQETFIECADIDPKTIHNPKSWLTKICSNKGLDHLKSAYKKRETYTGPWLPDAIPDSLQVWDSLSGGPTPDKNILLSESLTTSFLILMERLTPEERVVYLLSEVFDYPFKEIAEFLQKSEEACRKIAERARKSVLSNHAKFIPGPVGSEKVIAQFFEFARNGDRDGILNLLGKDSQFWSDGGGKVSASPVIMTDPMKIAHFFVGLSKSPVFKSMEFRTEFHSVNQRPGVVISAKLPSGLWAFDTIMSFEMEDGKIARIYAQRNPDKLKSLVKSE